MAELATIARPYAEAMYKVAGHGDAKTIAEQIDTLAALAADPQLRQFADSPKVGRTQVYELMTSAVKTPLADAVKNLLRAVIDNGRLTVLPEIATQFHALVNARSGVSDALVYSAYPLNGSLLTEVVTALEKRFGRKLNASVEVEPELIGGIKVVVGDEVLDTSVKARLEQMKVALSA